MQTSFVQHIPIPEVTEQISEEGHDGHERVPPQPSEPLPHPPGSHVLGLQDPEPEPPLGPVPLPLDDPSPLDVPEPLEDPEPLVPGPLPLLEPVPLDPVPEPRHASEHMGNFEPASSQQPRPFAQSLLAAQLQKLPTSWQKDLLKFTRQQSPPEQSLAD